MRHSGHSGATERRALKRWHLIFYLRVFNQDTEELLGHIIDISESGMMLVSDAPIPVHQEFHVWIDVPEEVGPRQRIHLQAYSLWSRNDINPDFYDTGFRLTNTTSRAMYHIETLIESFKSEFHIPG